MRNVATELLAIGRDDAIALITKDREITYRELRARVDSFARGLLAAGIAKGDRIILLAQNSDLFVVAYLATIRAGACSVPVLTNLSDHAMRAILERAEPSLIVSEPSLKTRFADGTIPTWTAEPRSVEPSIEFPTIDPSTDLAAIIFTSGSTGAPKGVMISHENILTNTRDIASYLELTTADRVMTVLPFAYCYGASLLHTHLVAGGSVVIDNRFMFAERVLDRMIETRCTGFAGVPSTYQILLRRTHFMTRAFPDLRWLQQAGGRLPDALISEVRGAHPTVRFFTMYGQTEATARLSYLPPEALDRKLGSIGKGLPSTRLEVLRDGGDPVTPGSNEVGEIVAFGKNIALGYFGDEEATREQFKDGGLRTGDIGRVDAEGFIYIEGRASHFIKCMGYRISPKEIEDVLLSHPDIVDAAVRGERDDLMGERLHAFVVVRPASTIGEADLKSHCLSQLPTHMVPSRWTFIDDLPKTPNGKLDRNALREL